MDKRAMFSKYKPQLSVKDIFKKSWVYFKKYKLIILIATIMSSIAGVTSAVAIYFTGTLYDRWINNTDNPDWANTLMIFIYFCIALLFCYLISNLFNWLANLLILKISERGAYHLRTAVFKKLHTLPIKYFDQTPSGEIISRTANDIDNISNAVSQYLGNCVFWLFTIISMLVLMFMVNWALSLIVILIYPLMFFVNTLIIKKLRPFFGKQQKSLGNLNGFIEEYISGTKIVSLFQMQNKTKEKFEKINEELTKNSIVANATSNIMMPLNMFFNNLSFVILAAFGITLVALGFIKLNWGVIHYDAYASLLIVFTLFARNLTNPINQLISTFGQFMLAIASADRVFNLLDQKSEQDSKKAITLKNVKGKVEAINMSFGYEPKKNVLSNINFISNPGTITALVGPTGAGKTTIVNLITKFYDISSGELKIDDISINNIRRESLRSSISMVLQDTYLFGESIYQNIRYGRLNATKKEIIQAAKLANCHSFIMKLPNGYDEILDDNGQNLSQGQRQLLAIARAFLSNSEIVILDEATSSIDTKTEIQIQTAMAKLIKNKTTFIIAHRLSTIENANNILVINKGKIIEHGKHKELINKKGFYYDLYNSQFKGIQI